MGLAWSETEALMRATARVEASDGLGGWVVIGTAFFVTANQLLTCAHVAVRSHPLRVVWHDGERRHELAATIAERHPDVDPVDPFPEPDVALLEVPDALPAHPTAWLDDTKPGDDLWAFGYSDEYRAGVALGHPVRFTNAGVNEAGLWTLQADRVKGGMSGAPLLDLATGRVVGLVKRTRDAVQALGGFAVGMDAVFGVLPALRDANVAVDPQARDLALAEALWGGFVLRAEEKLRGSPAARAVVAQALDLPEDAPSDRLARALFAADLDVVGACATQLRHSLGDADALALFEAVAMCASFKGEPWVTPAVAAELDQQVALLAHAEEPSGRVLALRSRLKELPDVYRRRGDRDGRWWRPLGNMLPFSHVPGTSGLPKDVEDNLRVLTAGRNPRARAFTQPGFDPDAWERERARVVGLLRRKGVVGYLPCERVDAAFVDALVDRYRLVFVLRSPDELDVPSPGFQQLPPGIDDDRADEALDEYFATWSELGGRDDAVL